MKKFISSKDIVFVCVYIYIYIVVKYKAGYEFLKRETWKNTRDPLSLPYDSSTKMGEGGR